MRTTFSCATATLGAAEARIRPAKAPKPSARRVILLMTMVSLIAQYEVALWPCRSANATTHTISFSDYPYGDSGPAPVAPMSAAGSDPEATASPRHVRFPPGNGHISVPR